MTSLKELDEIELEIYRKYKYALLHIGVQLSWEDVQEAIVLHCFNLENACQKTIELWKRNKLEHPTGYFLKAVREGYKSYLWKDEWMDDPNFKNPCLKYWEDAEKFLGKDLRNQLIIDIREDEQGNQYIFFSNGNKISLRRAISLGWQQVLEYAQGKLTFS